MNSPLVGRSEELGRVLAALARAAAGSGGTLLLAGEAGIGKSPLATETSPWPASAALSPWRAPLTRCRPIHLGTMLAAAAERAATLVPSAPRVLDVGAGAAPWSLTVAARDPSCQVTAVDLPAVVPATRLAVSAAGYGRQFRFVAGDLFEVDLGRGAFDLAIAGNLCHLFDEPTNRRLLCRLYDTLRPGGTLAVMDIIPDERPRPRWVALYELGLLLRTVGGCVHPLAAYLDWLRDAGFEPPEQHRLVDQAQAVLLVARKLDT